MRKLTLAFALMMSLCGAASAQQQDFSKVNITVTKVAGNVYMLQGEGGNIGVSVGDDGIVIVDDQYAPLADKIKAALKGISDKPVRFVINTHHHMDHTGSNAIFQAGAPVIAHDNVRKRLEAGGAVGNGVTMMDMKPSEKQALPIITFEHDMTLHLNGEDIRALHFASGHTDGDAVIFFPKSKVVHMGDDFVTYGFPFVDLASGGSVEGMIDAVDHVISMIPADTKVIPGHGGISTVEDMKAFLIMLRSTRSTVAKAVKRGQTLEQMRTQDILQPWSKFSGPFVTKDGFLEALYNELTNQRIGPVIKHN